MKQQSRRAKGKKLQRIVRDKLLSAFPDHLSPRDIRVAKTGENGEDLKISRNGRRLIPYQFSKACRHGKYEPVLIVKQNTRRALAVIDLDQFIDLIK